MKHRFATLVLMALLLSGVCAMDIRPSEPFTDRAAQESSIYMLAGEFRTVVANLLWFKADNYHHEFVARDRDWSSNRELLGLLELIVMLDPQFEEAYAVAACIYADGCKNPEKAISVLHQGISSNPQSRELYELLAVMHARRLGDLDRALLYAKQAVRYSEDDFYLTRTTRMQRTIERMIREQSAPSPNE